MYMLLLSTGPCILLEIMFILIKIRPFIFLVQLFLYVFNPFKPNGIFHYNQLD